MATTVPSTTLDEDNKVQHVSHLEHGHTSDDEKKSLEDDPLTYFTPEEQKKIIHRLDRRLVVVVGVMYCVSLMDRTNLSNAAIAGMNVELNLGIEMRYVSLGPDALEGKYSIEESCADIFLLTHAVYHHPRLLHHIYHFPASRHRPHSQDRPSHFPRWLVHRVGCCHDRNGFHTQLGRFGSVSCDFGSA